MSTQSLRAASSRGQKQTEQSCQRERIAHGSLCLVLSASQADVMFFSESSATLDFDKPVCRQLMSWDLDVVFFK